MTSERSGATASKECPLCGESMKRVERETTDVIPGTSELKRTHSFEWVCPDCDYFEEIDEIGPKG